MLTPKQSHFSDKDDGKDRNKAVTRIKLVLAEDHTLVREGLRELLSSQSDMEIVGEAADGEQALDLVGRTMPDVVLMDIAMPQVNGIEATRRIKRAYPSVSVLILTAHYSQELILAVVEAGAAGYMLKDARGNELLSAIRAVNDGEAVLHPAVADQVFRRLAEVSPANGPARASASLTARELEILTLAMEGLSNEKLAQKLSLGPRTVQTHWRNIFNKLGVSSRTEAVVCGLRNGWVELDKKQTG